MRVLKYLIQKEFRQIFRNTTLLKMIVIMPIIQLLILPMAADYEMKNINIAIVDKDNSDFSRRLISEIGASGYFIITEKNMSYEKTFKSFENNKADIILEIPHDFEKDLVRENHNKLFIAANAINGTNATVGATYLGRIITSFNQEIQVKWINSPPDIKQIEVVPVNWFNRLLNYRFFMVPGILVVLVTMIGAYMCALNIVKEKEVGTIEQINVTPIKKYYFILGKLIPFWIIAIIVFSIGFFGIGMLVYGIHSAGSLLVIYTFMALFLIAALGIGLIISTYSNTQQQAMSLAFFIMMIFLLMSGLYTPIESMPQWARIIAKCNPVTYFIEVMRMVVLKGSGWKDLKMHFLIMGGFAVFFNTWAVLNYKKAS